MKSRTGVLLINLGTPDSPEAEDVRTYLAEFLADPRVIDINPVGRWALLNLVILPKRPAESSAAYKKIWTDEGSPLLVHGLALVEGVTEALGDEFVVELGMRYGNPSIKAGLDMLIAAACDTIVALPLYPHYASSSTGSTIQKLNELVGERWNTPFVTIIPPFYGDPRYIEACAAVGKPVLEEFKPDRVLMSFHGLPERHLTKGDPRGHCFSSDNCCDEITTANRNCYRAQCFHTARALAAKLELDESDYVVCFQSRLGRTPWIQPFTDEVLPKLAEDGVKRIAVLCPAFVADCLETLEEIAIRARDDFREAGGEDLCLVPAVNSSPDWVECVAEMIRERVRSSA